MADQPLTGLRAGVLHGDEVQDLFRHAKAHGYALPAVNVTGTDTVNGVLEAAKALNSPVMVQFSNGGAQFYAGKSVPNDKQQASIAGGISGALARAPDGGPLRRARGAAHRPRRQKAPALD